MDLVEGQHQHQIHCISIAGIHSVDVPKLLSSHVSDHQARCQDEVIAESRFDLFRPQPLELLPGHELLI